MTKIGILSDTHGYWDDRYATYFAECDMIWHAGDIGSLELIERLEQIAPVVAVYGNIDGQDIRKRYRQIDKFRLENVCVMMTHIGGYPGHYAPGIGAMLAQDRPNLFVAGHSHILKVMFDKKKNLLYINPGAAGKQGFHQVRTLIRMTIDGDQFKDLEVIELPR